MQITVNTQIQIQHFTQSTLRAGDAVSLAKIKRPKTNITNKKTNSHLQK